MISVIIPIYNRERYIERCLSSLFAQTLKQIEFVFVDDCSTDGSFDKLTSSIEKYPELKNRVTVVRHDVNKGVAAARNTGLAHASKRYIGWVDVDDQVDPEIFENLYKKAEIEQADIVWSDYFNIYSDSKELIDQDCKGDKRSIIIAFLKGRLIGSMWNKLFRRDLFFNNNIRFVEGLNMCEDLRVNISLFYYAEKFSYLNEAHYFYDKTLDNSISSKSSTNQQVNVEWIENVRGIVAFIESVNLDISKLQQDKFKLTPKKNLLVKGRTIEAFKEWKNIFPEANYSIRFTNYPIIYKLLAFVIDKEYWMFARLWLVVKYNLLKR